MPTFNLRRFSQPDTLKAVTVQNLTRFLYPHAHYFSNRGFTIPPPETEADGFDYDTLADILMTPDDHVPSDLVEVLHLVNEMSTSEAMDELLREADVEGIVIDSRPDPTPTDVAIQVYFQNPRLLESKHSEQLLTRARTFQYFQAKDNENTDLAPPSEDVIRALETDLDNWFVEHNRGRGSRVFHYVREDGMWFLVRHGEPCKREGSMLDGEPGCVYYRPGKHDVLIYQPTTGEIGINAGTKSEVNLYKRMFGLHLFGNEEFFPGDGKYTLKPLRDSGADIRQNSRSTRLPTQHLCRSLRASTRAHHQARRTAATPIPDWCASLVPPVRRAESHGPPSSRPCLVSRSRLSYERK